MPLSSIGIKTKKMHNEVVYVVPDSGYYAGEEVRDISNSVLEGKIMEATTGDELKLSDIWIDDKRILCDTNGVFHTEINPGKYKLEARSMGFKNYKYNLHIKKGEAVNLSFYLDPYSNDKGYKHPH